VDGPPAREPQLAPAPCDGAPATDLAGDYRCEELEAVLTVADAGGALYGGFSGFLGQGRMELLGSGRAGCLGAALPRALDHTPSGDWTLAFQRDAAGRVARASRSAAGSLATCLRTRRLTRGFIGLEPSDLLTTAGLGSYSSKRAGDKTPLPVV